MLYIPLLQISEGSAVAAATAATTVSDQSVTIIDLVMSGGIFMIPIFILSVAGIYIFVERLLSYKKADKDPQQFLDKIKEMVLEGDLNGAKLLCTQTDTPVARVIEKGLSRIGSPIKNIEAAIENVGKIEVYKLEKNLAGMATVSGGAPMLGFLGTVTGMIQAFIAIAQQEGTVSPKLLSGGIYEAMVTTAAGLIVGIPAYMMYNYLIARVQKITHKMEYASVEFLDLLQETK
jgi:biopolymer transport protein ExbB